MKKAPTSNFVNVKRELLDQIVKNTIAVSSGDQIQVNSAVKPYVWMEITPGVMNDDCNGYQDITHKFGLRVIANDEDECWTLVEQLRKLWYTGSLDFKKLHDLGVLRINNLFTYPGIMFGEDSQTTCDLIFEIVIRYKY